MNIAQIGPWILLVMGVGAFCAAGYQMLFVKAKPTTVVVFVFGGLFAGLSVYGPAFVDQYLNFVKVVVPLQSNPSEKTYQAFFKSVGAGETSPEYAELGLAYVLDRPVAGTDKLLQSAATQATDPAGKAALERAHQDLAGKEIAAVQLAKTLKAQANPEATIKGMDSATRTLVSRELLRLPDSELRTLRLNTNEINRLAVPRSPRIGRPAPTVNP